jgi:predicted nucleic acid-binding protein
MTMEHALESAWTLWHAPEVERLLPAPTVVPRTLELMETLGLGRKRILDTALAATLEAAGVRRLATFNAADYRVFPFLEVVCAE